MRIDSSGRVGIGADPADYATGTGHGSLRIGSNGHIQDDSNSTYFAHNLYYNAGWKFLDSNAHYANYILMADDGSMQFANTTNTGTSGQSATVQERMRITSGGDVEITGGYSSSQTFQSTGSLRVSSNATTGTGNVALELMTDASSTRYLAVFTNSNGIVGNINTNGSATAYVTSSDYRLKENVVEMTGALDRVSNLKPSRFNFIADADKTVDGFLAHEVSDIVPEAITGTKDEVDDEGNPVYQGIDQSKLVPLLVGAIQELKAEIETLKSQINN
jgi:hypothetical protein